MLRNGDQLNYGALPPRSFNEDHIPIIFVIDRSGSMTHDMPRVCAEINRLRDELAADSKTSKMVETAIVTFNDDVELYQDFRPVCEMKNVNITAEGGTELQKGLMEAINVLRQRGHEYHECGIPVRIPFVVLVTDGYGGDVSEVAELIKQRTNDKKMMLWTMCVPGYDGETVARLSGGKRVFETKEGIETDYKEFFQDVIGASVKAVSGSVPGENPGWKNPLNNPESNLTMPQFEDDWLMN